MFDPRDQYLIYMIVVQTVEDLLSEPAAFDKPDGLEYPKMMGNGRL